MVAITERIGSHSIRRPSPSLSPAQCSRARGATREADGLRTELDHLKEDATQIKADAAMAKMEYIERNRTLLLETEIKMGPCRTDSTT